MVTPNDLARNPALSERANLEYLRKRAKAHLADLKRAKPDATPVWKMRYRVRR